MGVLTSTLFVDTPPATNRKLEACAIGKPNEISTHFAIGEKGDHVRVVKQALKNIGGLKTKFVVDNSYDNDFADAVAEYKRSKGKDLLNYAGKIDNIVGIKTIRSLDRDQPAKPSVKPSILPPVPQPGHRTKRITKRVFFRRETTLDGSHVHDSTVSDILRGITEFVKTSKDPTTAFGEEELSERETQFFDEGFGVNEVVQVTSTHMIERASFDLFVFVTTMRTVLTYTYNRPNSRVPFLLTIHNDILGDKEDINRINILERRVVDASLVTNPPRP